MTYTGKDVSEASVQFWTWFRDFASDLPADSFPDNLQDALLAELHKYDDRLFFLVCTTTIPRELIITGDGNTEAFPAVERLVNASPSLSGWAFFALKPPMGFDFTHNDGPISLTISDLWFKPLKSDSAPNALGVVIGFPDADFVLDHQSVDTAYTILETALGERSCATDISYVSVDDLPDKPAEDGYLALSQLADYIAFHKRRRAN